MSNSYTDLYLFQSLKSYTWHVFNIMETLNIREIMKTLLSTFLLLLSLNSFASFEFDSEKCAEKSDEIQSFQVLRLAFAPLFLSEDAMEYTDNLSYEAESWIEESGATQKSVCKKIKDWSDLANKELLLVIDALKTLNGYTDLYDYMAFSYCTNAIYSSSFFGGSKDDCRELSEDEDGEVTVELVNKGLEKLLKKLIKKHIKK